MSNWVTPCPNCPGHYRAIGGDGPQPSPILCIAERPGRDENTYGRVLCGKTGQEFDELYLPLAGLERRNIRCCNTVLCWADNNKTPTDKEIAQCAPHHIPQEIERTKPGTIILMGSTACKLVSGIKLDHMHGIPQHTRKVGTLFGWSGWIVPMFHPSIGLHEGRWMTILMEDWQGLKALSGSGAGLLTDDPPTGPVDYRTWDYGFVYGTGIPIAIDTESHGPDPWSVQVSSFAGSGALLRTTDRDAMRWLQFAVIQASEVVLHNAAYDLEVLRRLDVRVRRYRDTMQEAYQLGNLPQGLKALSYRLFRHTMTSFEETVRPASIRALQDWMIEAFQLSQADLSWTERVQLKTKVRETVKAGDLEKLLTRLMRLTDTASDYDPWERLDAFWRDDANSWMIPIVESRVGPYPILSIANCSMSDAVKYAVGDADWTGRVAIELERRRHGAFEIYDGDKDV